ncbi:maleylpyruvate isomerase N-terminal domain-containing protein [Knoellia koreensis]|uniref:Mycothiol-dependent maleylpyruvate isomerase metal-binding domain-containing protein n=1 Tax=Knoellia koreensis TaxID=2730921 RepID=A0A849HG69_9MICO|nr:maleylpyruvate isomerase N-terminal domain-containing protein [Knoellia sp. DB2414S]NNM45594.1 hypothetical protein [Knoellia sp. DB2414S]
MLDHYRQAPWVAASRSGSADPEQLDKDNTAAAAGPDAVLEEATERTRALEQLLAAQRDPDTVFIPWQGWSLTTDDWLTTRMMEMLVHADDLASSVGLRTPEFPEAAVVPVVGLLASVAADRHGATAVVRALSRPQRARLSCRRSERLEAQGTELPSARSERPGAREDKGVGENANLGWQYRQPRFASRHTTPVLCSFQVGAGPGGLAEHGET